MVQTKDLQFAYKIHISPILIRTYMCLASYTKIIDITIT